MCARETLDRDRMPGANKWSRKRERARTSNAEQPQQQQQQRRTEIIIKLNEGIRFTWFRLVTTTVSALFSPVYEVNMREQFYKSIFFLSEAFDRKWRIQHAEVQFLCRVTDGWDLRRSIGGHLRWTTVPSSLWLHNCTWTKAGKTLPQSPCFHKWHTKIRLKWVFRAPVNKLIRIYCILESAMHTTIRRYCDASPGWFERSFRISKCLTSFLDANRDRRRFRSFSVALPDLPARGKWNAESQRTESVVFDSSISFWIRMTERPLMAWNKENSVFYSRSTEHAAHFGLITILVLY